jgi:hypothetical protein
MKTSTDSGDVVHPTNHSGAGIGIIRSSGRHGQGRTELALGFALELDAIGIVHETVQNGIGESGIRESGMPCIHRDLSSDQGGTSSVSVIEYLQEITGLLDSQGVTQPVIEDEELGAGQGMKEFGIGTVDVRDGEIVEEAGSTLVADREAQTASGVAQSASQKSFSSACGTQDDGVEMTVDPFTLGQFEDKLTREAAGSREVEVFKGSRKAEAGSLEIALQTTVVTAGTLAVNEESQAFLKGQVGILGIVELFLQGGPKTGQTELGELVKHGLGQHSEPPDQ